MKDRDIARAIGLPVPIDLARAPKTRHGGYYKLRTTRAPADPGQIARRIEIHLAAGEWSMAKHVLEQAEAELLSEPTMSSDPSFAELGLDARTCTLLEARDLRRVSDAEGMSDDDLLELPNIGLSTVARIRAAMTRQGAGEGVSRKAS